MKEVDKKRGKITDENLAEAKKLKAIWDSEEGKEHRKRAGCVSQEAFGAAYNIGNQAAVGFFLNGKTALSLKAAIAFAKGLGCDVEDFSPRLSKLAGGRLNVSEMVAQEILLSQGLKVSREFRGSQHLPDWLSIGHDHPVRFAPDFSIEFGDGDRAWVFVEHAFSKLTPEGKMIRALAQSRPRDVLVLDGGPNLIAHEISHWLSNRSNVYGEIGNSAQAVVAMEPGPTHIGADPAIDLREPPLLDMRDLTQRFIAMLSKVSREDMQQISPLLETFSKAPDSQLVQTELLEKLNNAFRKVDGAQRGKQNAA